MSAGLAAEVELTLGDLHLRALASARPGRPLAVVGPNGAGKTTLLRAMAGLVPVTRGRVVLDGRVLDDPAAGTRVPPEERDVGVVFQRPLLFPHLDALDNVAFGLRRRGVGRAEARRRAAGWLERVGAADCAGHRPAALSGGQAQRVAVARALAPGPRLLLLDEPLAAVDAAGRDELRRQLSGHLREFGGTLVLVTHDPVEALGLAHDVVVLEGGRVTQAGPAPDLRARPATPYVAAWVGVNLFRGTWREEGVELAEGARLVAVAGGPVAGLPPGSPVAAVVHPRAVALYRDPPGGSPRNTWAGTVRGLHLGDGRVRVEVDGAVPLVAEVTPSAVGDLVLAPGTQVWASVKASEVEVHPD